MKKYIASLAVLSILLSAGCSQSLYMKGKAASEEGNIDTALKFLYMAVEENPDNYRAWREIGTIYYEGGEPGKAEEAFAMSNRIRPNAPSSLYLGLIMEERGEFGRAIKLYGSAVNLEGDARMRERVRERLDVLIDRKLEREAVAAVRNESDIETSFIPDSTIAVINFDGSALDQDMKPLALGLAELTANDLAKISSLNVIERIKINTILDELKFSQSRYADPAVAPRVGKLLGSRRLVLGNIVETGDEELRIDGAVVNTIGGDALRTGAAEGKLKKFFEVQKNFVFSVIDTLGIQLTREERDAIEEVPTESFLAFMAFSRGLYYQKEGMPGEAVKSFREAGDHDPGFSRATNLAGKMQLAANFGAEGNTGKFKKMIDTSVRADEMEAGLGNIQNANLFNNGFIRTGDGRYYFGIDPLAPPGGGEISTGYGVIVIEGNLDAD
ncbi:MAG: tetratricopeptide repeat protein [Candidatus Krumholzibacteriales bacterium]